MSDRLKEYISIAVMLALTAFFFALTPADDVNATIGGGTIFPNVLMGLMVALIGLKLVSDLMNPKSKKVIKDECLEKKANKKRFWIILASIAVYIMSVDYIGFYVSSFIFFFGLTVAVQYEKRTPRGLFMRFVVVTLFMAFLYVLFTIILMASLPKGIFF